MNLFGRAWRALRRVVYRRLGVDERARVRVHSEPGLRRLGGACGWVVPERLLAPDAVCYCVGAGEDISFDIALAREFDCGVHTFDPTPRAIAYVESLRSGLPSRLVFHPWGLWEQDRRIRFYAPRDPAHVSHSAVNLQRTDRFFEADCKRLRTIMRDLGHRHLDLLKLDIEGAEYRVLESMLADGIVPRVLAVEFDEVHDPIDDRASLRIRMMVKRLLNAGYRVVSVEGPNYTFVAGNC
jgi:FkbM family methyltransferase